jgi:hypothetical protein
MAKIVEVFGVAEPAAGVEGAGGEVVRGINGR